MNALDKALFDYHNTEKTIAIILKETGLNKSYFYRHLDYKEKFREKKKFRKYTFNIDKFKQDSSDKYYWLGFIAADGSIVNNTLSIELKSIDEEHLKLFNEFSENTKEIEKRINNLNVECVKVQINSYELIEYLKNYNLIQNKSLIYTIPEDKIPQEYIMDFIRGIIDGDGCIRINNHQQISLSFCGGNETCVRQVRDLLGIDNKIKLDKQTYSFQVTGNIKAKKILDKIYESSTEKNRLDRKYCIYKTLC